MLYMLALINTIMAGNRALPLSLTLLFLAVTFFDLSSAQFEDVRCKCVCPSSTLDSKPNVTVKNIPAEDCDCGLVTLRNETECLRCECNFQSRNTGVIKAAVIFVITIIAGLLLYFVILLICDPSSLSQDESISVQEDEQASHLTQDSLRMDSSVHRGASSWLARFGMAQKRWKKKVQKQREDIFENQTILS